jgi:hypothetical protein
MDAVRESLERHEQMTHSKTQTNHYANQPAKQDEKQVEIALQMHRVQLVDVAHLSDLSRSQCDLRDEANSLVVVLWFQTMDDEHLWTHLHLARYRQTTRQYCRNHRDHDRCH